MCGYVRRHIGPKTLREFLELIGYHGYYDEPNEPVIKHLYPAFGGNVNRTIEGLLIEEEGELKLVDATCWYHCEEVDGELKVGHKKTFNARNFTHPVLEGCNRESLSKHDCDRHWRREGN